jgi:hypothetical protein
MNEAISGRSLLWRRRSWWPTFHRKLLKYEGQTKHDTKTSDVRILDCT